MLLIRGKPFLTAFCHGMGNLHVDGIGTPINIHFVEPFQSESEHLFINSLVADGIGPLHFFENFPMDILA